MKKIYLITLFYAVLFLACSQKTLDLNSTQTQLSEFSLIMTGDALLHSRVYKDASFKETNGTYTYDFSKALELIKPIVSNFDLAFYNQESILGGKELGLSTYPHFNSPQEFGQEMIKTGFNLVSLANNHTLDRGEEAVLASLNFWRSSGVTFAGSAASFKEAQQDKIMTINGIKVGFLAYTYGTNGIEVPKGKEYLVNLYSKERLKNDIQALRAKVDLLLVSMHWGREYEFKPSKKQRELAQFLAKQGVDIIIGTHSHLVSPIEFIDDTLVIYSLGNFISSQIGLERRVGVLVGLKVQKEGAKISFKDLAFELLYTYHDKNFKNFKIYPFKDLNEDILPGYKAIEQRFQNIILQNSNLLQKGL